MRKHIGTLEIKALLLVIWCVRLSYTPLPRTWCALWNVQALSVFLNRCLMLGAGGHVAKGCRFFLFFCLVWSQKGLLFNYLCLPCGFKLCFHKKTWTVLSEDRAWMASVNNTALTLAGTTRQCSQMIKHWRGIISDFPTAVLANNIN